MTYDLALIT